jgi:hypothetical protein
LDETQSFVWPAPIATGALLDGTPSGPKESLCADWTSTAGSFRPGVQEATGGAWTTDSQQPVVSCGTVARLYCFGTRYRAVLDLPRPTGRPVFLSTPWTPQGGIAGADAHCAADATAAGLPGRFLAMISNVRYGVPQRFSGAARDTAYVRVDGLWLTHEYFAVPALTQGDFEIPLNVTAARAYVVSSGTEDDTALVWTGGPPVWTSSGPEPTPADHCNRWQGGAGTTGAVGRPDVLAQTISFKTVSCEIPRRLYCAVAQ